MVCFFEFLTPFNLGGYNFFNSIPFSMIFNVSDTPIGGLQVLLDTKNNGTLPLNLAYPEHLSVIIATQFTTKEQLKDLTHRICFRITCYKLYKERACYFIFSHQNISAILE